MCPGFRIGQFLRRHLEIAMPLRIFSHLLDSECPSSIFHRLFDLFETLVYFFIICLQTTSGSSKASLLWWLNWFANISDRSLVSTVPLHESRDIKLWLLENLDLANVAVLDREDARGFFCDLFSNRSGNELLNEGFKVSLVSQFGHSRNHLCSNGTSLRGLGVARALDLILLRFL